jgi:hypothetical protein
VVDVSKQPQKAYWDKHPYTRHSVKRELLKFMGWNTLLEIIEQAEHIRTSFADQHFVADWIAVDFAEASRINESVLSKVDNFLEHPDHFEVVGLPVIKRFEKIGQTIICKRCGLENEEYEVACQKCGANLVFAGRRKFQTRPKQLFRTPFQIPNKEPTTKYLIRRLKIAKENEWEYLFFNPHTKKPITDSCFYTHFRSVGEKVGIDLWPHRNRAERAKQLVEEYEFNKDDLKRFMMIVEESTLDFYAGTSVPYEKKMGIKKH